ncbi:MAG: alpha/beta hydrolase [Solobacterium sp.]|nr:alpha/beta hydrolase [Solobacterium sp.]
MNREDKLRLAQKCRESGAFRPADPSILEQMPVKPVRKFFDTGERKTDTWIFDGTHGKKGQPLFINLHGGGFIKARADRDSVYCSMIADEFQASVWDVDYVLAPEDPFPAAVYESCSIIRYAYMHAGEYGFDRDRIFLLGHSAGANLACGALILNQREPSFRIRGLVLDYIPADQRQNPFTKIKKEDYSDERRVARALTEYNYLELYMNPEQCIDELASPVLADKETLSTFPDTLLITAGLDSLLEEGEEFGRQLIQAGVSVTMRRFTNSPHGFTINRTGEWEAALALHKRFIRSLII